MKKVFVSVIPKKNANPEEIKQVLKPYIRRGIVKCVSDSPTEKNTVEVSIKSTRQGYLPVIQKILKNNGYQVTIKKQHQMDIVEFIGDIIYVYPTKMY